MTTVSPTGVPAASRSSFDWCSISAGRPRKSTVYPSAPELLDERVLGAEQHGVAEHGDRAAPGDVVVVVAGAVVDVGVAATPAARHRGSPAVVDGGSSVQRRRG